MVSCLAHPSTEFHSRKAQDANPPARGRRAALRPSRHGRRTGRADACAVFRFRDWDRRRARAVSARAPVPAASGGSYGSGRVRAPRDDDRRQPVRAGQVQLPGKPGSPRAADRYQPPAGRPAGAARRAGPGAGAGGRPVLFPVRRDPFDRGGHRADDHQHRPSAGDRGVATDSRDSRQHCRAAGAVAEPGRPDPRHRPLVRHREHRAQPGLSGPLPALYRSRRQPRLVHVHAEGDPARHRHPPRVQAADHPRHAPDGTPRRAHVRAAVQGPARSEHPSAPAGGAGADRAGDGVGARRQRQAGDHLQRPVRSVDSGAPVHGLPRAAAHPDRDRQRQPRRPLHQSERAQPAAGPAAGADELPRAVRLVRLAPRRHRGVRGDRHLRRAGEHGEVPHALDGELPPRPSRLGRPRRGALRVRRAGGSAGPFRHLRAAGYPALRRGRDPPVAGAVPRRRRQLPGGVVGDPARPAVRRVRQDHAGEGRSIPTCATTPAVRPFRPTTSPGTRSAC